MAQGMNASKTPARPSHEALEPNATANEAEESEQAKMDRIGMEAATRSTNRIHANEETNPADTIFSK